MRLQQMAKALGLSGPWDWASAGASWIVSSTAFGASFMVLVIDNVPLGPDFGLAIDIALAGAACIGLWLTLAIMLAGSRLRGRPSPEQRRRCSRRRRVVGLGFLLLGVAVCSVAYFMWSAQQRVRMLESQLAKWHVVPPLCFAPLSSVERLVDI